MLTQTTSETTLNLLQLDPDERILFANAHGDDESMAHGQTISNLTAEGVEVFTLTATDGEQNGDPATRRTEANTAYDHHGVPEGNRFYLEMPDAALHQKPQLLRLARNIGSIANNNRITTIVTPGWEGFDGHSDHRAMHIASVLAATVMSDHDVSILALDERGALSVPVDETHKLDALAVYESQFRGKHRDIAELHYPSLLKVERFDKLAPWQHLSRALYELGQLQRHIPIAEGSRVN